MPEWEHRRSTLTVIRAILVAQGVPREVLILPMGGPLLSGDLDADNRVDNRRAGFSPDVGPELPVASP